MKYEIYVSAIVEHRYIADAKDMDDAIEKYNQGLAEVDPDYFDYDGDSEELVCIKAAE